jgi:hypothetical protein
MSCGEGVGTSRSKGLLKVGIEAGYLILEEMLFRDALQRKQRSESEPRSITPKVG